MEKRSIDNRTFLREVENFDQSDSGCKLGRQLEHSCSTEPECSDRTRILRPKHRIFRPNPELVSTETSVVAAHSNAVQWGRAVSQAGAAGGNFHARTAMPCAGHARVNCKGGAAAVRKLIFYAGRRAGEGTPLKAERGRGCYSGGDRECCSSPTSALGGGEG